MNALGRGGSFSAMDWGRGDAQWELRLLEIPSPFTEDFGKERNKAMPRVLSIDKQRIDRALSSSSRAICINRCLSS